MRSVIASQPSRCSARVTPRRSVPSRTAVIRAALDFGSKHYENQTRRSSISLIGASLLLSPLSLLAAQPATAGLSAYNINKANSIEEVSVNLGNANNDMVFEPAHLEFTAGKVYKLKMYNPSNVNHYFTALEFADKIYTILVETGNPGIEEVELDAGTSLTWIFVPIKPGTYPLKCTVTGHTEGGMLSPSQHHYYHGSCRQPSAITTVPAVAKLAHHYYVPAVP
eukprot:gene32242-16807_t